MFCYREGLASLLASAMFTSMLFPTPVALVHAGGVDALSAHRAAEKVFKGDPPVLLAAEATKSPISQEKLQAIVKYTLSNENTHTVDEKIAVGLGFTHPLTTKQARFEVLGVRHGIAVVITDPTRMIFFRKTDEGINMYACTLTGKLVSAGTFVDGVFRAARIGAAVTKAGFEAELFLWDAEPLPESKTPASD